MNNITGSQVAVLVREFDEVEFTRQLYCLANYYNQALVGIEANFTTYPIKELDRLGYDKQFVRETEDTYTHKKKKSLGFKTTRVTRPLILGALQKIVTEDTYLINDRYTLEEMLTFTRNERGRPEAEDGSHDDMVMALAIAYYCRSQQTRKAVPLPKPKYVMPDYSPFDIKPERVGFDDLKDTVDYGENLIVV